MHSEYIWMNLKNGKKSKNPIFTTKDSVDVYEGDKVYYICKDEFNIRCIPEWNKKDNMNYDSNKTFSKRSSAEEYIIMNKPCLSINDIDLVIKDQYLNEIKKLVKTKLNL